MPPSRSELRDQEACISDTSQEQYPQTSGRNTSVPVEADAILAELITAERKKDQVEQDAWRNLQLVLNQTKLCRSCKGFGHLKDDEDVMCPVCQGTGSVPDVNMSAVKLVMQPKFPTTNVNINTTIDSMDLGGAMNVLRELL